MPDILGLSAPFFTWVQASRLATTISQSLPLTAGLSAFHLIGFTLILGGALVSNLRLLGVFFPERPIAEIVRPARRGIALGLVISVTTGVLLFSARASVAAENGIFQLKMLLLVAAAVFHFGVARTMAQESAGPARVRAAGAIGLALWFGVALAGCAFILLE